MDFWNFLKRWFLGKDWGNGAKDCDYFHDDRYDTFHDTFNEYFNDTFHDTL